MTDNVQRTAEEEQPTMNIEELLTQSDLFYRRFHEKMATAMRETLDKEIMEMLCPPTT